MTKQAHDYWNSIDRSIGYYDRTTKEERDIQMQIYLSLCYSKSYWNGGSNNSKLIYIPIIITMIGGVLMLFL